MMLMMLSSRSAENVDDDDVYYYNCQRLKLEGETENMCVWTKKNGRGRWDEVMEWVDEKCGRERKKEK